LRQLGALAIEWSWQLDPRRANARHCDAHHDGSGTGRLCLRTAQPTRDRAHLQRLLAEHLAQVQLPAPVGWLRLRTIETAAMAGLSASLLAEPSATGVSQHQFVERLMARLGAANVRGLQPLDSHLPEAMQMSRSWPPPPAAQAACQAYGHEMAWLRAFPSWLLAQPKPLTVERDAPHYQGRLQLLSGPQRIEDGWLADSPALRDYFVAHSPQAGLLWVYRDRLSASETPQWFLHGFFA